MTKLLIIVCLNLAFPTAVLGQLTNVTVNTPVGTFVGFKKSVSIDGSTVELSKFLGIPYAEPPIAERRFQKPVVKAPVTEPLLVQTHGSECIQLRTGFDTSIPASEDCLFLNIYAPGTTDIDGPLAVMIWIHGGGYVFGSANTYIADLLAARGNVIVVTINYRLSVLGFLNLGSNRPSNFGLWDQHMAIRWVHNNIESFGGDKERITIFGESAGAGSVIMQGIYPGNRGLFQRIIAESGTASAPWSESLNPIAEAEEFAAIVGCTNTTAESILNCLKNVPAKVIYETLNDFSNGLYRDPIPFVPSVDNDFILMTPKDILNANINVAAAERSVLSTFDLLIGANAAEGAGNVSPMNGIDENMNSFLPNRTFFEETLIPHFITQQSIQGDKRAMTKLIAATYTTWNDPENPRNIRQNYVNMYGDYMFLVPSLQTTELYAQISRNGAYMYHFTAKPSVHLLPAPSWIDGPNHGDELIYVFGEVNTFNEWASTGDFQEWEKDLSRNIMIMWTNFAKSGNPNQPRDTGVNWLPYTKASKRYLDIGKTLNETVTKESLILDRVNLWDQLLPAVNEALARASGSCDVSGAEHPVVHNVSLCMNVFAVILMRLFYK